MNSIYRSQENRSFFISALAWISIIFSCISILAAILFSNYQAPSSNQMALSDISAQYFPRLAGLLLKHPQTLFAAFGFSVLLAAIALLKRKNWGRMAFIYLMGLSVVWCVTAIFIQYNFLSSHTQSSLLPLLMTLSIIPSLGFASLFAWIISILNSAEIKREFIRAPLNNRFPVSFNNKSDRPFGIALKVLKMDVKKAIHWAVFLAICLMTYAAIYFTHGLSWRYISTSVWVILSALFFWQVKLVHYRNLWLSFTATALATIFLALTIENVGIQNFSTSRSDVDHFAVTSAALFYGIVIGFFASGIKSKWAPLITLPLLWIQIFLDIIAAFQGTSWH